MRDNFFFAMKLFDYFVFPFLLRKADVELWSHDTVWVVLLSFFSAALLLFPIVCVLY